MGNVKQIDMSGSSFMDFRDENMYYVDKTLLIKDILDSNRRGIYLFTRPRRFGKTMNLSMLDAFFNLKYKGNGWFDGLAISDYPEYGPYRNNYPVIHLDMKPSKGDSFDEFISGMKSALSIVFEEHSYLLKSEISGSLRDLFMTMDRGDTPQDSMVTSLLFLSRALEKYHDRKVIILIDEYDCAVSDSFGDEHHRPILNFLRRFLGSTLKGNPHIQMAYMTGVMQIAKESIFSDLNNLVVNNIFSDMSDERFGFTKSEVKEILAYYGHPEKFDEAKEWYDGYHFGNAEVFNPYSMMYYAFNRFLPKQYWVDSGGNWIIRSLLECINDRNYIALTELVTGGAVRSHISRP